MTSSVTRLVLSKIKQPNLSDRNVLPRARPLPNFQKRESAPGVTCHPSHREPLRVTAALHVTGGPRSWRTGAPLVCATRHPARDTL
jgi:hypothetical protein